MMQFAHVGQWGDGLYFSQDASYSHFYASAGSSGPGHNQPPVERGHGEPLKPDELEMLCCDLLLGSVVSMDRDEGQDRNAAPGINTEMRQACQALRSPPFVNAPPPLRQGGDHSEGKYDTVKGFTQVDMRLPDGTWIKNPKCPRSRCWIVYENGRACAPPPAPLSAQPSQLLIYWPF